MSKPASCSLWGETWPRDPRLEVSCPRCYARVGSRCKRPSEHQAAKIHLEREEAACVAGFVDRRGVFRSTLGSSVIGALADRVVFDYLVARPPCFLEEPYELQWLLSYYDTRVHRGTLYRASGFDLFRTRVVALALGSVRPRRRRPR